MQEILLFLSQHNVTEEAALRFVRLHNHPDVAERRDEQYGESPLFLRHTV
jgi:hypothetical protein